MRIQSLDIEVSRIGLGTAALGTVLSRDDSFRLLDAYAELGGNLFDCAHCYAFWEPSGEGMSERTVGEWLSKTGLAGKVVLSTKGGHPPLPGYGHPSDFLSAQAILQDYTESRVRLGGAAIDLYHLHRDDGSTPVEEIIDTLNALPDSRAFAASNWSMARFELANWYASASGQRGFVALQSQWSLATPTWAATTDPTVRFLSAAEEQWCRDSNIAILAYSSTANGYFDSEAADGPFGSLQNAARRARARDYAAQHDATATQVALTWLLGFPTVIPLIGTTRIHRVREAMKSVELRINPKDRDWLWGED